MIEKPLLSICIPTYNRADVLDSVIQSIVSDPEFNHEVELIISDNCSSDNTKEVVAKYTQRLDNVFYYCNQENVQDLNFAKVLSYGKGEYLKLQNDYLVFLPGGLKYLKEKIKANIATKCPLFFTGDSVFTKFKQEEVHCHSMDQFVQTVSTYVTWISNFGAWQSDFSSLKDIEKYRSLQLMQVDWTYQIVAEHHSAIVYDKSIYLNKGATVGKRGGYNWFKVQIANYYQIMSPYVASGSISKSVFVNDKINALKHFRSEFYVVFAEKYNPNFQFDKEGSLAVFWKYYKTIPLFYLYLIKVPFKFVFNRFYKNPRLRRKENKQNNSQV